MQAATQRASGSLHALSPLTSRYKTPLLTTYLLRRSPVRTASSAAAATAAAMSTAAIPPSNGSSYQGVSITELPKSWNFTASLPHDAVFPTPADSHKTPRENIGPRQVRGAFYTWVRPSGAKDPELLAVSPAAMRDIGIQQGDEKTDDFLQTVAGNKLLGWDEGKMEGGYPWAQCYGGFQFGSWAGQLGDGRAISLFESRNPATGIQYELQLKGAGLTPYSRFADGKAVLRSSIREFIVSEALHALGIPSTRALSLTSLPHSVVRRELPEPGAIVLRFAQSWLRLGTFDLLRARGEREMIRQLATYTAENVLGGWDALPARLDDPSDPKAAGPDPSSRNVPRDAIQGEGDAAENRFARFYREVARRNALTVAKWQAYGFMNGVLNTDNTSVLGLSIDFGPFAFMDDFDPAYTPNHDDHMLRYSYRNQPTIIWWNLVRLGESLGELIGGGPQVDDPAFVDKGVEEKDADAVIARAEKIITQTGEEYKAVFLAEYKRLMSLRLGLASQKQSDFDELFSVLLDTMDEQDLDFNHFFRRLGSVGVGEISTEEQRKEVASRFFHKEGATGMVRGEDEARTKVASWLDKWRVRILEDWPEAEDEKRMEAMNKVNPNFVPRSWILDEIIGRVQKKGERDVLNRAMHMALHPFQESWDGQIMENGETYQGDKEEEMRWVGDPPQTSRAMQCSCSS